MMPDEDLSLFFDPADGAVRCTCGGHVFYGWFNAPQGVEGFEQMDVQVTEATLTAPTVNVAAAGIAQGGEVTVDVPVGSVGGELVTETRVYTVSLPRLGGDGAMTHVRLGARKT